MTNSKIQIKLTIAFLMIALLMGMVFGIYYNNLIGAHGEKIRSQLIPLGDRVMEIKLSSTKAHLLLEEIIGGGSSDSLLEVWELFDHANGNLRGILKEGDGEVGRNSILTENVPFRTKMEQINEQLKKVIKLSKQRHDLFQKSMATGRDVDPQLMDSNRKTGLRFDKGFDQLLSELSTAKDMIRYMIREEHLSLQANVVRSKQIMILSILIGILLAMILAAYFSRFVSNGLNRIVRGSSEYFGETSNLSGKDEIGELFQGMNGMNERMKTMVNEAKKLSDRQQNKTENHS